MIKFDALVFLYQQSNDLLTLLVVNGIDALHFKVRDEAKFEVGGLYFLLYFMLTFCHQRMMQSHVTHASLFLCQFLEDQQMCLSDSNVNIALLLAVVF